MSFDPYGDPYGSPYDGPHDEMECMYCGGPHDDMECPDYGGYYPSGGSFSFKDCKDSLEPWSIICGLFFPLISLFFVAPAYRRADKTKNYVVCQCLAIMATGTHALTYGALALLLFG